MKVLLTLVVVLGLLGGGVYVMSRQEGSAADLLVERADAALDRLAGGPPVGVSEQGRELAVDDVTRVARRVEKHAAGGGFPGRLDGLGFAVGKGRHLAEGNHLDAYARTRRGFKVCVVNVGGAWAAWVTSARASGVVASGTTGGECAYR